jgi:hypothetical protein
MVHGFEDEAEGGALFLFEATLAEVHCDEVLDIPIYKVTCQSCYIRRMRE